ncbi:MAG: hypothetical protein ABSC54_01005 [Smithellaceae bacterium]
MKSATRNHIIYFGILVIIILILGSIEYYLRSKNIKVDNEPYKISFYTRDGKLWSPAVYWWTNPNTLKWEIAPYTIYKHAPNQKTPYFTTNSKGFRGSKEYSNFSKKGKRIIVVGGSAAFGHSLSNDNETFQAQMEKLNSRYEVINAGVGGFYSGQELTYIVTELVDYHPNIIIAFDGFNDLFYSWYYDRWANRILKDSELGFHANFLSSMEDSLVYSYQQQTSVLKSFQRFFNNVMDRSILLSKIREKITKLLRQNYSARLSNNKISDKNKNEYFEKILDVYTKNLIKMHDFCNSQGIKFLVVFQPEISLKSKMTVEERNYVNFWQHVWNVDNYLEEYSPLSKRFITRSKAILTKKGVRFIDINDQPEYKNNPNTLFLDFVHLNKAGNTIIAHIINEHIK